MPSQAHREWTCQSCKKIKPEQASDYAKKIVFLRRLILGGYPFQPDELTVEDWQALGLAAQIQDTARLKDELAPWL